LSAAPLTKRAVYSLCGRGFRTLVFFGRLRRHSAGGDGSAKKQMNGGANPFGAFDAGKAAKPAGQFRGGDDRRSGRHGRLKEPIEAFRG